MNNGFVAFIQSKIQSKIVSLKQSLIFYPIIFSIGALILFLITSRIDELVYGSLTVDIPFLQALVFGGSPNAARSILSTIVAGWATILGVAFSVTLITLQLATTRYTSHIVASFEDDKINQLMLGWFIAVVVYSLLVLKTVRTEEADTEIIFTPIIGVNVAVLLAIIALFIFVLFLHNISSYLKSKPLVSKLSDQIILSVKPYQKRRQTNEDVLLEENKAYTADSEKTYKIKSKTQGVLRYINWKIISTNLQDFALSHDSYNNNVIDLRMDWSKSLGEWIEQDSLIATIYVKGTKTIIDNGTIDNKYDQAKLLSGIDIAKDQDISTDPVYGIEALRSLALKSINQFDTNIVNSCITGIFRVLNHVLKSKETIGIAFDLSSYNYNNKKKYDYNQINKAEGAKKGKIVITVHPKESKLSSICMIELSSIYMIARSKNQDSVIKHFADEYTSLSRDLLEQTKTHEFEMLTDWYNNLVLKSSFRGDFHNQLAYILTDFEKELSERYPYAKEIFTTSCRDILTGKYYDDEDSVSD